MNSDLYHAKNNQMARTKKVDFALSKLVYFKTQLSELVESSIEVLI